MGRGDFAVQSYVCCDIFMQDPFCFTQSFQQTERQTDKCRALHNLLGRGKYPKRSIIKEPQSAPGTGKTSFAPSSPHKSTLIIGALEAVKEEKETQGQLYNLI